MFFIAWYEHIIFKLTAGLQMCLWLHLTWWIYMFMYSSHWSLLPSSTWNIPAVFWRPALCDCIMQRHSGHITMKQLRHIQSTQTHLPYIVAMSQSQRIRPTSLTSIGVNSTGVDNSSSYLTTQMYGCLVVKMWEYSTLFRTAKLTNQTQILEPAFMDLHKVFNLTGPVERAWNASGVRRP